MACWIGWLVGWLVGLLYTCPHSLILSPEYVHTQLGFTTAQSEGKGEGRSSRYCTDIAKMLQARWFDCLIV
jgi:hypothetical protein